MCVWFATARRCAENYIPNINFQLPPNSDRLDRDMIEIHMQTAPKMFVCGGAPKKPNSAYLDIEMN